MAENMTELREKAVASIGAEQPQEQPVVDNNTDNGYIDGNKSETGDALSQANEISADLKKQYGIPDHINTLQDLAKHFSDVNSKRGQQANEVSEWRKNDELRQRELALLRQQQEYLMQRIQPQQKQVSEEDIEAEIQQILAENPINGIRRAAKHEIDNSINPLRGELDEIKSYIAEKRITDARTNFMAENKLTKEDTDAMADIIANDIEFYRGFKTNEQRMKAALLELRAQRGDQSAIEKTKEEKDKQVKLEEEKKQASVISPSNQRPPQTKKKPEELKAALVARMKAEGLNY